MAGYTSAEIKAAIKQGAVAKVDGKRVIFAPVEKGDRSPWREEHSRNYYPASRVTLEGPNGGPWAVAKLLRF